MSRLATDKFNAEVAIRLAAVRAASGMTQAVFAASIGLSDRAYSNYERGEREVPAMVLKELAAVYNVDPLWMLQGGDDEPEYVRERKMDPALLQEVFDVVARELKSAKVTFTSAKYAKFLYLAYRYAVEDREAAAPRIRDLIRIAS